MGKKTKAAETEKSDPLFLPELLSFVVPLSELHHDPRNARIHDDRNVAAIAYSLKKFGQRRLAVVQKDGMIIRAGNGMIEAARRLGWDRIAVLVVDEVDETAREYALADNRSAELADWDASTLADELRSLPALPESMWDAKELERILLNAGGSVVSPTIDFVSSFSVLIECDSEDHQRKVIEDVVAKGLRCRAFFI